MFGFGPVMAVQRGNRHRQHQVDKETLELAKLTLDGKWQIVPLHN